MNKLERFLFGYPLSEPRDVAAHSSLADLIVSDRLQNLTTASTALAVAAVYRARQMNADTLASLPLADGNGTPLMAVNESQPVSEFIAETVLSLQDCGDAYWEIGTGRTLTVLDHNRMHVEWADASRTVRRYRYDRNRIMRPTGVARNLHVLSVNRGPGDLTGIGWMESDRIDGILAEQKWSQEYFENHGNPSGILKKTGNLTAEEARALRNQWEDARTVRGPAVLAGNLDWTPTGFNADDSEWVATHKAGVADVATLSGVPGALLNLADSGSNLTYTNLADLYSQYWRMTLRPTYASRIEHAIAETMQLFVRFDPEELYRANLQTRADAAAKLVYAGYDPTDVADAVSLPAMTHTGVLPTTLQPDEEPSL